MHEMLTFFTVGRIKEGVEGVHSSIPMETGKIEYVWDFPGAVWTHRGSLDLRMGKWGVGTDKSSDTFVYYFTEGIQLLLCMGWRRIHTSIPMGT